MKTLYKGMIGKEVQELQALLGITADGQFGPKTEQAVVQFQISAGLSGDGIVGTMTWEKLGKKKPTTDREKLASRFGDVMADPRTFEINWMMTYFCQKDFPELPMHKIYCNRLVIPRLKSVFASLKKADLLHEIRQYGGCWNPRYIRGYEAQKILSLHTYALPVDFNTIDNALGVSKAEARVRGLNPFSEAFDQVWRDEDWTCGIDFKRADGMHFQPNNV